MQPLPYDDSDSLHSMAVDAGAVLALTPVTPKLLHPRRPNDVVAVPKQAGELGGDLHYHLD